MTEKRKHKAAPVGSGIYLTVLGDFGPFSRAGKSIGYMVEVAGRRFLIDCGSPLFNQIGGHGLKDISGLFITHCHDDHKRWFTDLSLFHRYAPDFKRKLSLIVSEDVLDEIKASSAAALDRSLSIDSARVTDIPFLDYVDVRRIGPTAKYRIVLAMEGEGLRRYRVMDSAGHVVGPEQAKVVIHPQTGRARLLWRDPGLGLWVEPESFYPFSSQEFYGPDKGIYQGEGFTIEAVNAPVWHGIPGIGLVFRSGGETLFITSDTVHDVKLWERLANEDLPQRLPMSQSEFDRASVIIGDINDYIQRAWSIARYEDALACFKDAAVVQDVSLVNSVVHTDYVRLKDTVLDKARTLLTHCPDRMTSEWGLCYAEKTYAVRGNRFVEKVGEREYPIDADIYHKEAGRLFVGYRCEHGAFEVHKRGEILKVHLPGSHRHHDPGDLIFRVELYEDVGGGLFPVLDNRKAEYRVREDKKVERLEFHAEGSRGFIVEDERPRIALDKAAQACKYPARA